MFRYPNFRNGNNPGGRSAERLTLSLLSDKRLKIEEMGVSGWPNLLSDLTLTHRTASDGSEIAFIKAERAAFPPVSASVSAMRARSGFELLMNRSDRGCEAAESAISPRAVQAAIRIGFLFSFCITWKSDGRACESAMVPSASITASLVPRSLCLSAWTSARTELRSPTRPKL